MAIRMATLNAAVHFRLDHLLGSVTPSRLADVMLLADLADPRPAAVFVGGVQVAEDGRPLFVNDDSMPAFTRDTMHLTPDLSAASFAVRADGPTAWVQAMEMYDGYFKRAFHAAARRGRRPACCDTERDVVKMAIVDRHHATSDRSASASCAASACAAARWRRRRTARTRTSWCSAPTTSRWPSRACGRRHRRWVRRRGRRCRAGHLPAPDRRDHERRPVGGRARRVGGGQRRGGVARGDASPRRS